MCRSGQMQDIKNLQRLWLHESTRVFADRLVNNDDKGWFFNNISTICQNILKTDCDKQELF
jgi:dynein heavy chain